jgi:hypothetical protein
MRLIVAAITRSDLSGIVVLWSRRRREESNSPGGTLVSRIEGMRDPLGHWHIVGARAPPLGAFAAWAEPNVTDRLQLVRGWWQHPGAG